MRISQGDESKGVPEHMKSKSIIIAVVALVTVGGGVFVLTREDAVTQSSNRTPVTTGVVGSTSEKDKMAKEDAMKKSETEKTSASNAVASTETAAMVKGSFSDYSESKLANAEKGKVVLFFSASWCPTCQEANKNLNASTAPDGLTLLKLDYDKSTELKKKYGVTYQHTYVQVDKDGKLIKKWSGSKSYDQIKSQAI